MGGEEGGGGGRTFFVQTAYNQRKSFGAHETAPHTVHLLDKTCKLLALGVGFLHFLIFF